MTMRNSPGMPIKPRRRSSLSRNCIAPTTVERAGPASTDGVRVDTKVAASRLSLMSDGAQKKTPLYEEHVRLGAKMIPFGDWIMPVQYSSIMDEHQAVRNNVGVFDISHMGQLVATGPTAGAWLNEMLTNNTQKLEVGTG